jgi:hypothetical protein
MRVFFAILILLAFLPRAAWAAPFTCPHFDAPQIAVNTDMGEPVFNFSLDRAGLNKIFAKVKLPDAQVYHLTLDSVMTGEMTAQHDARMRQTTDKATGATCLGLTSIAVTLRMRPVIYMATEFRKTECQYKALFEHELKHVKTDDDVMTEYAPRIRDGLQFAFNGDADSLVGPVPLKGIGDAKRLLEAHVAGAVQSLFNMMMRERIDRQHAVDSVNEYQMLTNAC